MKSNMTEHASQIEMLDLHVQHLLLDRNKFENYQNHVVDIEKKCDSIIHEITSLQENTRVPQTVPSPTLELSQNDVMKICDIVEKSISDTHANVIPINTNLAPPPAFITCESSSRIADLEKVCSEIAQTITELKSPNTASPQSTPVEETPVIEHGNSFPPIIHDLSPYYSDCIDNP